LVTTLAAAEKFTPDHLQKPEIKVFVDNAKFFYIGGFFLTHGIESALEVAKAASGKGKVSIARSTAPDTLC
jgi:adenosine kinase